jgi:hypothetical protein
MSGETKKVTCRCGREIEYIPSENDLLDKPIICRECFEGLGKVTVIDDEEDDLG